ncbi:MAG TPA: tetratricopeptide repeat protein [Alphaproteobacteria bacterium]|nr:tetratricopeptide repeat protein [Alphaproteobacteria bacterium]
MKASSRALLMIASILAFTQTTAVKAQDENPTTPGAIPNPGTYQGSMELQRRSDQQDQQFRQQQSLQPQYQQPRYNPQQRAYGGAPHQSLPSAQPETRSRQSVNPFGELSPGDLAAQDALNRGDWVGAVRLWRPLAERGDVNAEYNLGVMYDQGHGVGMNKAEAARWYLKAAERGMSPAMLNLGNIIVLSSRGPADMVSAYKWFLVAARDNDPGVRANAQHNLGLVAPLMLRSQIARAEAQAQSWSPK